MKLLLVPTALLIAFMWAASGIIQKFLLRDISPRFALIVIGLTYAVLLMAYGLADLKTNIEWVGKLKWSQWLGVGAIAALGIFVPTLMWYKLLAQHDAHKVNTLTSLSPMFTLLLAALLLKEEVSVRAAIGVALIVVGIICISGGWV